jgi:uncharacterized metal-binding protein YceD (DUF177 family)
MSLRVTEFLASPGRRFPISITLKGGQDPQSLCTVESIELAGEGFAQLSTLYLEVILRARLVQPCRRCLEPVKTTLELDEPFEVAIPPNAESVDLLPVVLRLVLSAHAPNVVCREGCRGLCPACGVNLNRHPDHTCGLDRSDRTTLRDFLT